MPSIMSYSFGVQHTLPGRMVIDAAYVGNVSRHLLQARNVNPIPIGGPRVSGGFPDGTSARRGQVGVRLVF